MKKLNKKYHHLKIILLITLLLSIPFITYKYWLPEVADYLIVTDKLQHADVVVALSGNGFRYQHAITLFKDGYADHILFNYNEQDSFDMVGKKVDTPRMLKEVVLANGIPLDKISIEGRCTSTYEDILYAKEYMLKNNFKSVIIVSNNFHMRRVLNITKRLFKGTDLKAIFVSVPADIEGINPYRWWTREYDLVKVFNEYLKIGFYKFKYGV